MTTPIRGLSVSLSIYSNTFNTHFHQMQLQKIHTSGESQTHGVRYLLTF